MSFTSTTQILTHEGAMTMLKAAIARADQIGQPQCIVIVDASGELVAEVKMTGAKFLSRKSALAKALTAASIGGPSTNIPEAVRPAIGAATQGCVTGLPGGLPVKINGILLGGIGIGSGSGDQDIAVANAALRAVSAEVFE
ncbi:MAG: heme-binding protein [Hyphomicrobiales bacterium]